MAASDPVFSVPTPTGTLQGCAAFAWDGAAWQPAGRAYSSVATPTGVLRGIAPFSWSGSAWTPAGQAMPGVPTPTGTLDGVALYTWSGSAWTPVGGAPDVPTPTGTLQGVAGFQWDGTAWQPAGQAGPEVATPTGVLQGVALFNWSGNWMGSAPSLNLDLTAPPLDPRITFTRASTATYFDSTGTLQTAAANAPRFDTDPVTLQARGLLIEEQRTNSALWSTNFTNAVWQLFASATKGATLTGPDGVANSAMTLNFAAAAGSQIFQNITIAANTTFSVYARVRTANQFAIKFASETASAPLNLTANWQRFSLTCTGANTNVCIQNVGSSAGSIDIWAPQLEVGAFPTSYIPTTSAAVTRSGDFASMPTAAWYSTTAGSWVVERRRDYSIVTNNYPGMFQVDDGSTNNRVLLYDEDNFTNQHITQSVGGTSSFDTYIGKYASGISKIGFAISAAAGMSAVVNGGSLFTGADANYPGAALNRVLLANASLNGWLRRVRYWPRVLSNSELQQVTT